MVQSDLVIRGGTVIDGTGAPGRVADIEIREGRIVAIGRSVGPSDDVVDAEGHIVTSGFIDGHTHLDAQMFWDLWGVHDRGRLRPGHRTDLNVIDPDRVQPNLPRIESDLPGGAKRFTQNAEGTLATIVEGTIVLRDGVHTGALPGRLLRNAA